MASDPLAPVTALQPGPRVSVQTNCTTASYAEWAFSGDDDEEAEPVRQVQDRFVMMPDNMFRRLWECLLGLVLIYVATLLPFRLSFMDEAFHRDPDTLECIREAIVVQWWTDFEMFFLDPFFIVDLVLNFFYSYTDKESGRQIVKMHKIALQYLQGSFIIDLIACLPGPVWMFVFGSMMTAMSGGGDEDGAVGNPARIMRMQKVSKIARLVRLARLMKLGGFLAKSALFQQMNQIRAVRMMNFLAGLFTLTHLFACMWYYCAAWHEDLNFTWVSTRELYDGSVLIDEPSPVVRWMHAMYFVLTVFTTVGYGDMCAYTVGEVIFVMLLQLVGIFVNSTLMSMAINIASASDDAGRQLDEQKAVVKSYCDHTMLSATRGFELKESVQTRMTGNTYDREKMRYLFTSGAISRDQITKLPHELFGGKLRSNKFVTVCGAVYLPPRSIPPRFTLLVALACHQRFFEPLEIIYNANDHAWNIFLVMEGIFAAVAPDNSRRPTANYAPAFRPAFDAFLGMRKDKYRVRGGSDGDRRATRVAARFDAATLLSPYQLYGKGNFFGHVEILLDRGGPRTTCVRCEGNYPGALSIGGSLLVVHKDSVDHFIEEFPPCGDAWRLAAMRREVRQEELVKKTSSRFTSSDLAARLIQDYWNDRKEYMECKKALATVVEGVTSDEVVSQFRRPYKLKMQEKEHLLQRSALSGRIEEKMPPYLKNLQQDIATLRDELSSVKGAIREDVQSLQSGFLELSQALKAAIAKPGTGSTMREGTNASDAFI